MAYTRETPRKTSSHFFSAPPPGATEILHSSLSEELKHSVPAKFAHGLGNIISLTEAVDTFHEELAKGKSTIHAASAAIGKSVAEKCMEGAAAGLISSSIMVGAGIAAGTVTAPITVPILGMFCGLMLLSKTEEVGHVAKLATPILVDISLDKLHYLKISVTDFVNKAYDNFTKNPELKKATYQTIEVAMAELDYFQHLQSQGLYAGLDPNQRILYNWIARDAFSEYFSINKKGQLKNNKSIPSPQNNKINTAEIKKELSTIDSKLKTLQKDYPINQNVNTVRSSLSDKEIGEFLLNYGILPSDVAAIYENPEHKKLAAEAINYFKENEAQLIYANEVEQSQKAIQGIGDFCRALTHIGMLTHSKPLVMVGSIGSSLMQIASSVVTLTTMPLLGLASLTPMSMLLVAGSSLISTVLGFTDDQAEIEAKRGEELHRALYLISYQIHELYGRFDHIEHMLANLGGMINQVLHNQKLLSDQIKTTYQVVQTGFRWVNLYLQDFRTENQHSHKRLNDQFTYLLDLTAHKDLQTFGEKARARVDYINDALEANEISDGVKKAFIKLKSDIKNASLKDWNGQKEYKYLQNNKSQDLLLPLQFLRGRLQNQDDALGFLAEEIESLTGVPLSKHNINKDSLPMTCLWFYLVINYIRLSSHLAFESINNPALLKKLKTSAVTLCAS